MKQDLGETCDAILLDRQRKIDEIVHANKDRTEPYWILIFAKPAKGCVDGKPTLVEHIKPYSERPPSHVGAILAEVDNSSGEIKWEVNMPQVPFDVLALPGVEGSQTNDVVTETTSIPWAYVTK